MSTYDKAEVERILGDIARGATVAALPHVNAMAAHIAELERQKAAVLALCDEAVGPFSVPTISADKVRAIYGGER